MTYRKCSHCCGLNGQHKNIYPTISDALNAIAYLKSQHGNVNLGYYKCPKGNGYHLTERM